MGPEERQHGDRSGRAGDVLSSGGLHATGQGQGQPCYIGEYGVLPMPRNEKEGKFWAENPAWFTSFEHDPQRRGRL